MKNTPFTCMICGARFYAIKPFYLFALYWHVRSKHCERKHDADGVKGS